ncbi:MAG TPA: M23 family metallopeptidase [Bacteroidales bacterium]|nr:M23 family metallopeptidase [Bacteroidales bacterium]
MFKKKYFLDHTDLLFKQVRVPFKGKIIRITLWLLASVAVTFIYTSIFNRTYGSVKEKALEQEIEDIKLQYSIMQMNINNSLNILSDLELSDANRYRPVLEMDSIPASVRKMGTGGVVRYEELDGYDNSVLMLAMRMKVDEIKNRTTVQYESFRSIEEQKNEWKRELEYLPMISPVNVVYRLGDGVKFREKHPVLGTPQWHHGQDFSTPYGTEVFATGSGKVIEAGWKGGFGNCIVIDHGYGYRSTYGHLSNMKVTVGLNVKRGDLIGLTGSTGTSSGPHLHYQIDLFGQHRNPLHYFNDDLTEEEYFEMIQTLTSQSRFR